MTRIFKVSLSIVALLLVSLLVFTGCSEKTADEAFAAAEEAKEALVAATADFEKAIADKADTAKLTEEVDELTKAIENAEFAATDGDTALKSAITTAKAALSENTQAVVNALDVKIAELLAKKVDGVVVDAELARFEKMIENINNATGSYIKVTDFNSITSLAAVSAYNLEQKFYRMEGIKDSYDADEWANVEKAYAIAKVSIYRATSTGAIDDALAQFDKAVKENPGDVDALYYDICEAEANAEELYDAAVALYASYSEVVVDYYGKGNLMLMALELWRNDLAADVSEIANASVPTAELEAKIDAINSGNKIAAFNAKVGDCQGLFGADSVALLDAAAYESNVTRLKDMKADANGLVALKEAYANAADEDKDAAFTAWENAYANWETNYMTQAQGKDVKAIETYLNGFNVKPVK